MTDKEIKEIKKNWDKITQKDLDNKQKEIDACKEAIVAKSQWKKVFTSKVKHVRWNDRTFNLLYWFAALFTILCMIAILIAAVLPTETNISPTHPGMIVDYALCGVFLLASIGLWIGLAVRDKVLSKAEENRDYYNDLKEVKHDQKSLEYTLRALNEEYSRLNKAFLNQNNN